jgi:parvulin-like peptidyl-prolyl isomerase
VPQDAVAVVGNATISKSQFDKLLNAAKQGYKRQHRDFPKPGTEQYSVIRGQLVQNLVENAEYQEKAKDLGIKVGDSEVDQRLDQIKKQYFGSRPGQKPKTSEEIEKSYRAQIASQGLTDADVRYFVRIQLIREKIYKKVTKDVKVSDSDVKDYYNKHKKTYETPAQPESREVRHILVKSKSLADKIYGQLQSNPKDFPKLAKRYSVDTQTKPFGGRLPGGVFKGKTVPAFDKAAFSLKTNEISKPVHTQFGWHIIQPLSGIKAATAAKPLPFSQVKATIRQQLLQQKRQQGVQNWWNDTQKDFRHKIAYQQGYAPPKPAATSATTT